MKRINELLAAAAVLMAGGSVQASLDIPNGNPVGVASSMQVVGQSGISMMSVTLNISGGNNGDLYAYLSYDGAVVTLLNRPGVTGSNPIGSTAAGYSSVLVEDGAAMSLNSATAAAGSPVATGTYYASDGSAALLGAYGSDSGNGLWTLFVADLSGGGTEGDSQLNSWILNINGVNVPEPITWGLVAFGGGVLLVTLSRRLWKRTA